MKRQRIIIVPDKQGAYALLQEAEEGATSQDWIDVTRLKTEQNTDGTISVCWTENDGAIPVLWTEKDGTITAFWTEKEGRING